MKLVILTLFTLINLVFLANNGLVDYAGQNNWPGLCKGGQLQSPINIVNQNKTNDGVIDVTGIKIGLVSGPKFEKLKDGTVGVNLTEKYDYNIDYFFGKDKPRTYIIEKFTFHSKSEHTVNGEQFDLEMQILCNLDTRYSDVFKAILKPEDKKHKHLIVSVFFKLTEDPKGTPSLMNLKLGETLNNFDLRSFVFYHKAFFYYQGSTTTPNCSENVHWIVYEKPLPITKSELAHMREQLTNSGYQGAENARKVQSLNKREIYYRKEVLRKLLRK